MYCVTDTLQLFFVLSMNTCIFHQWLELYVSSGQKIFPLYFIFVSLYFCILSCKKKCKSTLLHYSQQFCLAYFCCFGFLIQLLLALFNSIICQNYVCCNFKVFFILWFQKINICSSIKRVNHSLEMKVFIDAYSLNHKILTVTCLIFEV